MKTCLILASQSAGRKDLLSKAGLAFEAVPADVNESSIRDRLQGDGTDPSEIADALAEAKAVQISKQYPNQMVLGSDQILVSPDGEMLSKAVTPAEAEQTIAKLAGRQHTLISAAVLCENGKVLWRAADQAQLAMRALSAQDISDYVARYWEDIRYCVGCYRIEAEGRALFDAVSGDESVIVGMPMPAILDYLGRRGYERGL